MHWTKTKEAGVEADFELVYEFAVDLIGDPA